MKTPFRRLLASGIAVMLGVLFITATLLLSASFKATLEESVAGTARDAGVIVRMNMNPPGGKLPDPLTKQARERIQALPEVESLRSVKEFGALLDRDDGDYIAGMNVQPLTKQTTLEDGRLPERNGEAAVTPDLIKEYGIKIGDKHKLVAPWSGKSLELEIVGVINAASDTVAFPMGYFFTTEDDAFKMSDMEGESLNVIFVNTTADPDAVKAKILELDGIKGSNIFVENIDEFRDAMKRDLAGDSGMRIMTSFFLGFGLVSFAVAALVIANTFTILVAQRTRQFALLRCIGATKRQVFGMVIKEAALTALIAGVVGVLAGLGVTAAAVPVMAKLLKIGQGRMAVDWTGLVLPIVAALIVTVLAALPAARQATRVAPMAALRPQTAGVLKRRAGKLQLAGGFVFLVIGVAALVFAAMTPGSVVIGIVGGIVSFVGLLMIGGLFIPGLIGAIGRPVRRAGVPEELAVDNALRNPSRTAATASALLIGVTLVSMMTVGAASAQKTMAASIDQYFPADLRAQARQNGSLTDAQIDKLRRADGVQSVSPMLVSDVVAPSSSGAVPFEVWAPEDVRLGLRDQRVAEVLNESTIVFGSGWRYLDQPVVDGTQITIMRYEFDPESETGQPKQLPPITLSAKVLENYKGEPVVTINNVKRVSPEAEREALVIFDKDRDAIEVYKQINKNLTSEGMSFSGSAVDRQTVQQAVDSALFLVLGLLAVAVVISIIGVGNTLSLAVIERTQEIGLLRALGLTRGQGRRMLSTEALLMGGVATVIGMLVGTSYGYAGIATLLAGEDLELHFAVPGLRMLAILVVAIAAAWLASIVPANRAAKISPQEALSTE